MIEDTSTNDKALEMALKEVEVLRIRNQELREKVRVYELVQKAYLQGMEDRKKGITPKANPYHRKKKSTDNVRAREAWAIGWKEQDFDIHCKSIVKAMIRLFIDIIALWDDEKKKRKVNQEELVDRKRALQSEATKVLEKVNNYAQN